MLTPPKERVARMTRRSPRGPRKDRELSSSAYDQLINLAYEVRTKAGDLPVRESRAAALIVLTIFQLSEGNVLVKVGSLAKKLRVDLHTLIRTFRRLHHDTSPKEMQIRIRSEAARRMLCSEPSRKIESIAAELGYDNLGAFTKFFEKQNGMPPNEFRRNCPKAKSGGSAQFGQ